MSSEQPKPGAIPGWGQPQEPDAPSAPGPGSSPGGPTPGWGQPQQQDAPAAPGPGGPPPATDLGPSQVPSAASPPPPAPPPGGPSAAPGWGQAPATPPPAAGTAWGAPAGGSPGAPPAGGWNPQPVAPSGSSGCLKIILVLVVIGVILVTLVVVALGIFANRITDSLGVNSDGTIGKPCTIIDNASLSTALGSNAEAIQLEGIYDATIGIVLDKRVLPNAEDCWITADQTTAVGRIARYVGGDAGAVFQAEREKAAPTSQDQGGGVSVTSTGYFGGDVSGLGDEAFCTGVSDAIQAGVLVRQGDTLVYVSLSGPADSPPAFDTTADGVVIAPSLCTDAQTVARQILH